MEAIAEAFESVLLLARELGLLRVGTVSVEGTKLDANASKRKSIRYDRAVELRSQLQEETGSLHMSVRSAPMARRRSMPSVCLTSCGVGSKRSWTRPARLWSVVRNVMRSVSA